MSFVDKVKAKARSNRKTIVLPESMDRRVIDAAAYVMAEGIADIILIGNRDEVTAAFPDVKLDGAIFMEPHSSEHLDTMVHTYYELRKHRGVTEEQAWAVISSMNRHSVNESLLFVELLTGRRHQIRVQFAGRGFPILGDRRYGYNDKRDLSVPTLALHACGLIFPHPVRKTTMAFYADPSINPSFCQDDVDAFNLYVKSLIDDGKLSSPTL
jgi:hypothetical protein